MKKKSDVFDYQTICTKDTPELERRKMNIGDIWSNSVKCLKCCDTIRSKNQHDYVECRCGSIAADGGSWYCKRTGDLHNYKELSEAFSDYKGDE